MKTERDNLEAWLREHPEAHEDFIDLPRLRALYQSAPPPEPEENAWNAVCSRLHESLARIRSPRPWRTFAVGAVAATILITLSVPWLWKMPAPRAPLREQEKGTPTAAAVQRMEEPFPVVEPDEITIISMDARNLAALVVGEPPIGDELEFARPEDIRVIRCERCPHTGKLARLEQGDEVPMFVTAAVLAPDK